jgi:hypothetical protein
MNQFPSGCWVSLRGHLEFLRKIAKIFTILCLSPLSINDTGDKHKILRAQGKMIHEKKPEVKNRVSESDPPLIA